jgi:nicotinamidase-related amidase
VSNETALLVIGAQVNMFAPGSTVHDGDTVLKTLGWLISRARAAGALVVFVQNNGGKGHPDQLGSAGWQIHPSLAPQAGDLVLQKSTSDAFHLTPLQKELTRRGIKRLVLAGMQSEDGVDATCRRASALDYDVTLVSDAHSTYDSDKLPAAEVISSQNASLSAVAKVVSSSAVDFQQGLRQQRRNFA